MANQINILEKDFREFLDDLSSSAPYPGGGGAAAAGAAIGAGLGSMVANLTIGKKKYADAEEEVKEIDHSLANLRKDFISLADMDAEAFSSVALAYKMPHSTPEEKAKKAHAMNYILWGACRVPLEIMEKSLRVLQLLEILSEKGSRMAISDVGAGAIMVMGSLEAASLNVYINTKIMQDRDQAEDLNEKASRLIKEGRELTDRIQKTVIDALQYKG